MKSTDHSQHCPCIGVQLCPSDHAWAHKYPNDARLEGFIISAHEEMPWTAPMKTFHGWVLNDCDGESEYIADPIPDTA